MIKSNLYLLPIFLFVINMPAKAADTTLHLIPQPVSITKNPGVFKLTPDTRLSFEGKGAQDIADLFITMIQTPTGYKLKQTTTKNKGIRFIINNRYDSLLGKEGYKLNITPSSVTLQANHPSGLFYGIQTLLQLLPPAIESKTKTTAVAWTLPCVRITDYPRFGWRGLMLDVSRHFFDKEFVKKYIDQLARYKMNVFHWHLTDDQGWRIEIKSLPLLTRVGAWRAPRVGRWWSRDPQYGGEQPTYGGYYTQIDIKEIVQYAEKRFVTIVPEIDVPGHSLAAIAAYPELSCTGGNFHVNAGNKFYGAEDNALCAGNDQTYVFMEKVLSEVAALFPGKYIHIGGDECYKGFWKKCEKCIRRRQQENLKNEDELQSYFIKRMEQIIRTHGKELVGWDEILEGGLAPGATVMSWRGTKGGIEAAKMNHPVVMTPTSNCYLDLYQGDPAVEPPTYSMLRLSSCYAFEPVPAGVNPNLILGGQGNLWTEWVPHPRHAEYMIWPRAFALAEVFWTPTSQKNWSHFMQKVETHFKRFDQADINYARSVYDPIISVIKAAWPANIRIALKTETDDLQLYYTFDGTYPDNFSQRYTDTLTIPPNAELFRVISYQNGKPCGKMITVEIKDLQQRPK